MDRDPYIEVATHFFNQFLELKIQLDNHDVVTCEKHDKEIRKWKAANQALREAAEDYADRTKKLEDELAALEEENTHLKGRLNEAIIRGQLQDKAIHEYPLKELMSEQHFKEWERIIKEIPRLRGE